MSTTNNVVEGKWKMDEDAALSDETGVSEPEETVEYDKFTEILADGKYGGELWADAEREKLRAQAEVRLSSKRNNTQRLQQATERLQRAVDDQSAIEDEFPAAAKWGKYYISVEAVNAKQAENNTP